jgi:hypothetical protein
MGLGDLGSIANILSALAVLATLIYLARQVKQGNMLARAQARQRMVEQANGELYQWMSDPGLRACFTKDELSGDEQAKMHYFLLAAMRQREWEFVQYQDSVIGDDAYQASLGVIALHLGVPRTRRWWATVGRIGFNEHFVNTVDAFLARKKTITYFEDITRFDTTRADGDSVRSFPARAQLRPVSPAAPRGAEELEAATSVPSTPTSP